MKTLAIVLPTIVLAVAVGLIASIDGTPSALFAAPLAQESQNFGFLGHVEFVHQNALGETIGYYQSDNLVMERGKDCVSVEAFDPTQTGLCTITADTFQFIGIGNATCTSCEDATRDTLESEMENRRRDTTVAAFTAATGGTGTIVVINTETPFTFNAANASDNVFEAGLFDVITPDTGNTFAIRNVTATTPNPGIDVNNGDTLDVTWTITVG